MPQYQLSHYLRNKGTHSFIDLSDKRIIDYNYVIILFVSCWLHSIRLQSVEDFVIIYIYSTYIHSTYCINIITVTMPRTYIYTLRCGIVIIQQQSCCRRVERVQAKGNDVLCDLWEDLKWLEYVGFRNLLLNTTLAQLIQRYT